MSEHWWNMLDNERIRWNIDRIWLEYVGQWMEYVGISMEHLGISTEYVGHWME